VNRDALEALFAQHCQGRTAMARHLPYLRALAEGCDLAVEYGVNRGGSTTALLLGAQRVISLDILNVPARRQLAPLADGNWTFLQADSTKYPLPECDLLFIDADHTYNSVKAELQHADQVRKYLAFHDTLTFASIGAAGESGALRWTPVTGQSVPWEHLGIRPAIDELMIRDRSWQIKYSSWESHGFLVMERVTS
jgi:hypothetical protein